MFTALQQLAAQLAGMWKQLGLNQRVSVVFGAGVVAAGLSALVFWSSRPDYALLYGRLDDAEAARVMSALDDAKVPYKTGRGGGSILVPSDKVYPMRAQLAAKGIPRGEGVGFEIFDKPNFGISDFVQRANYLRAIQGELARTISQMDPIESARVMVVMPENRLLVDTQKKPTASVFVRVKGNAQIAPSTVNSIRFLVANAVESLQAQHVTVVDNLGTVLSDAEEPGSVAGLSSSQFQARRNLEQYLAKKAEGMLDKVLGANQAVVRVAADINWDTITRVEEKYDPDGQVVRISTLNDENTTSTTSDSNGGVTGVAANTATGETNAPSAAAVNSTTTKKKIANNQYDINKTTSNVLLSAGGIRRLSAAVFVATKMEGEGADRKTVLRADDEILKIKRVVQSALGIQETGDATRKDEITVEQIPFSEPQSVPGFALVEDGGAGRQFYWEIGKNAFFALLALGVVVFFLKQIKSNAPGDIPLGVPLGEADTAGARSYVSAGGGGGSGVAMRKDLPPGVVTPEILNALIKENPANMTQAVRTWLTGNKSN